MSKGLRIALIVVCACAALALAGFIVVSSMTAAGKDKMQGAAVAPGSEKVVTYEGKRFRQNGDVVSVCVIGTDLDGVFDSSHNSQADAILVLALDTATGKATCLSVPRNTMVDIDVKRQGEFQGTERMQICLAYAVGKYDAEGWELLQTAISRLLYNTVVAHHVTMDMACVDELADAVGGVQVEALEDIPGTDIRKGDAVVLRGTTGGLVSDPNEEGEKTWEGGTAAWYIRYRDLENPDSPTQRTARQQQFARAFASQAIEAAKGDPAVLVSLFDIASRHSSTDLDASEFAYLASVLMGADNPSVDFVTLEGQMVYNDESEWGQYIVDKDMLYKTILNVFYTPEA